MMKKLTLHNETVLRCSIPTATEKMDAIESPASVEQQPASILLGQQLHRALEDYAIDTLQSCGMKDRVIQIEDMVNRCPAAVLCCDENGRLPIHTACQVGIPLRLIKFLLNAAPATIMTPTKDHRKLLPIHVVCRYYNGRNKEKLAIIRHLLKYHPETSILTTTAKGETALHCLLQNYFCTVADLQVIAAECPEVFSFSMKRGTTPLHLACGRHYMTRATKRPRPRDDDPSSSSAEIIQFLLNRCPAKMLRTPNSKGELPLHTAVRGDQSCETVNAIVAAYPDAVSFVDKRGRTALHIASERPVCCEETIQLLLQMYPEAADQPAYDGSLPSVRLPY